MGQRFGTGVLTMQERPEPKFSYEITFYRALAEPVLVAGVPRGAAYLNGTMLVGFAVYLKSWLIIPVCLVIHLVLVEVSKRDPQLVDVLRRYYWLPTFFFI